MRDKAADGMLGDSEQIQGMCAVEDDERNGAGEQDAGRAVLRISPPAAGGAPVEIARHTARAGDEGDGQKDGSTADELIQADACRVHRIGAGFDEGWIAHSVEDVHEPGKSEEAEASADGDDHCHVQMSEVLQIW